MAFALMGKPGLEPDTGGVEDVGVGLRSGAVPNGDTIAWANVVDGDTVG